MEFAGSGTGGGSLDVGDDFGRCRGACVGGVLGGGVRDVDRSVWVREQGGDVRLVLGVGVVGVGAGFFDGAVGAVVEGWFGHGFLFFFFLLFGWRVGLEIVVWSRLSGVEWDCVWSRVYGL